MNKKPRTRKYFAPQNEGKEHICDYPGCKEKGEYRAPKDSRLKEYYWFCLKHVQEYNKKWNYYDGAAAEEEEKNRRARMRFRWGGGYFDAAVIWLNFVKEVLGVSRTELRPDIPWWRWLAVRTYCHLTKWLVCTALCLPRFRRSPRWRELRSRYATHATAHLLSPAFWRR